jgi:hypothetical protein
MMLSFVDNFRFMALLCVSVIPLILLIKKTRPWKQEKMAVH